MAKESATSVSSEEKSAGAPKKARGQVYILQERCKGCGYCVEFCPLGVLVMSSRFNAKGYHYPEVAHAEKCSGCDLCGMYCPDFSIHGARRPTKE
ncbi:MAG: 4Fe-4S dicluster domain-containing protein [Phycisphaerae bacterium]|nr:4Fe-4S dicluster domain-containing protein [Phycisphaerae bacterium]